MTDFPTDDDMKLNEASRIRPWANQAHRSTKSNIAAALAAGAEAAASAEEAERIKRAILTGAVAACVEALWMNRVKGFGAARVMGGWARMGGAYLAQLAAGVPFDDENSSPS